MSSPKNSKKPGRPKGNNKRKKSAAGTRGKKKRNVVDDEGNELLEELLEAEGIDLNAEDDVEENEADESLNSINNAPSGRSNQNDEDDDDDEEDRVDDVDQILNNMMIEEPPFRQWQLSNSDVLNCLFSMEAWKQRFVAFNRQPAISLEPESPEQQEILDNRRKELRYLSSELFNIWSTGNIEDIALYEKAREIYRRKGGRQDLTPLKKGVDPMAIAFVMFFGTCNRVSLNPALIDSKMDQLNTYLGAMISLHREYELLTKLSQRENRESIEKLSRVVIAVRNAHHMLQHAVNMSVSLDSSKAGMEPSKRITYVVDNFLKSQELMEDLKSYQKYLLKLIERGVDRRYRRYRGAVYEEVITREGYRTNFWRKVDDIKRFVEKNSTREDMEMFILSTEGRNVSAAVEHLTTMEDPEFSVIRLDRHVFTFRNGIYFAANRLFRPFEKGEINWVEDTKFKRREDLGRASFGNDSQEITNASANYFDTDFVDYRSNPDYKETVIDGEKMPAFMTVPTPVFSKILIDQEVPIKAQLVVFGLVGRLLYGTGELDNWQVILWILGRAQTGKSTLCKLVELFYQSDDVAVISNNIEEKFGLESVYDKLIFMAPEIKRDFKLAQAEFQQMVSGEKMSIARKFKTAVQSLFKVPGMVAGNDMPAWIDSSHSIIRRIVLLNFMKRLAKVDGDIGNKLANEVGAILFKCNEAYHYILKEFGNDQIWDHLPEYFKKTQQKLKSKTHPLYAFLESDQLDFDPSFYVTVDSFKAVFQLYVRSNNLKTTVWNDELFMIPFQEMNLEISCPEKCILSEGGEVHRVQVIKGCRLRKDAYTQTQKEPQNPSPMRNKDGPPRSATQMIAIPSLN